MEVNYFALIEITKLAKQNKVKQLIFVSSIAATSHFVPHHMTKESDEDANPYLTDYEAPYDLSKRIAEDYILSQNSPDFHTIALRVSGILGGERDPFFHHRMFPFQVTFNSPIIIDYNYAENIADALAEMYRVLSAPNVNTDIFGQFYFYTGEHILENATSQLLAEVKNQALVQIRHDLVSPFIKLWQYVRWDHDTHGKLDIVRIVEVEQTFDQTKFHQTFPKFKPRYTVLEGLKKIYGKKQPRSEL